MTAVILQPSYIPWRGYFDLIRRADVFVFYDDVQYDKQGWRNRNKIKTPQGAQWITIPVNSSRAVSNQTRILDMATTIHVPWQRKHWKTIEQNYCKAPFFSQQAPLISGFYDLRLPLLADFTIQSTIELARALGITHTQFIRSSTLPASGMKSERLIGILKHLGATRYISGPSARDYIEPEMFESACIALEYIEYDYPEYPQLHGPFEPGLSIVDLLFNVGDDAPRYIWRDGRASD